MFYVHESSNDLDFEAKKIASANLLIVIFQCLLLEEVEAFSCKLKDY